MILQKNDFVTYRHNSVYSKVEKFSQGEKSVAFSQQVFFLSSKYIKPVKSACNSIMLRANPSPLEQTLSKTLLNVQTNASLEEKTLEIG